MVHPDHRLEQRYENDPPPIANMPESNPPMAAIPSSSSQ